MNAKKMLSALGLGIWFCGSSALASSIPPLDLEARHAHVTFAASPLLLVLGGGVASDVALVDHWSLGAGMSSLDGFGLVPLKETAYFARTTLATGPLPMGTRLGLTASIGRRVGAVDPSSLDVVWTQLAVGIDQPVWVAGRPFATIRATYGPVWASARTIGESSSPSFALETLWVPNLEVAFPASRWQLPLGPDGSVAFENEIVLGGGQIIGIRSRAGVRAAAAPPLTSR